VIPSSSPPQHWSGRITAHVSAASYDSYSSARRWAKRGSVSVVDQGLVSGANYFVSVFFVRLLSPSDYGAFSISFSLFLLLAGLHNAIVLEPLSVVGPKRYAVAMAPYLRAATIVHLMTAGGLALSVAAMSLLLPAGQHSVAEALQRMAAGSFFVFLFWLLRRQCYLLGKPAHAARASGVYMLTLLAGIYLWRQFGSPSPGTPFLIMGISSVAASLALIPMQTRILREDNAALDSASLRGVARSHWRYAQWILGAAGVAWLAELSYPMLLGIYANSESAGAYRAGELMVIPMYQFVSALSLPLQPWVSSRVALRGTEYLKDFFVKGSLLVGGATVLYAALLLLTSRSIVALAYPKNYSFPVLSILVPLCGWLIVRTNSEVVIGVAMRGAEATRAIFWSGGIGAVFTLLAGSALIQAYGIRGAAWSKLAGSFLQAVVLGCFFFRIAPPRSIKVCR
jgi:hypothetical protein